MARALVIPTHIEQDYYYADVESLEDYQNIVKGFIEGITLPQLPGTTMFINEEGKLRKMALNVRATALYKQLGAMEAREEAREAFKSSPFPTTGSWRTDLMISNYDFPRRDDDHLIVGPALLVNVDQHGESVDITQGNAEIATSVCDAFKAAV